MQLDLDLSAMKRHYTHCLAEYMATLLRNSGPWTWNGEGLQIDPKLLHADINDYGYSRVYEYVELECKCNDEDEIEFMILSGFYNQWSLLRMIMSWNLVVENLEELKSDCRKMEEFLFADCYNGKFKER